MYGLGDVAYEKGKMIKEIKKKIRMWDATVLMTRTIMSVNEMFAFHEEIIKMLEEYEITC